VGGGVGRGGDGGRMMKRHWVGRGGGGGMDGEVEARGGEKEEGGETVWRGYRPYR